MAPMHCALPMTMGFECIRRRGAAATLAVVAFGLAAAGAVCHAAESSVLDLSLAKDPLATELLDVDEAFVFTSRLDGGRVVARWDVPQGYYLYRRHFEVTGVDGVELGDPVIPPGRAHVDDFFGESEVYFGGVEISAAILTRSAGQGTVSFRYQGCAEQGFCYPPMVKTASFVFAPDGEDTSPVSAWYVVLLVVLAGLGISAVFLRRE